MTTALTDIYGIHNADSQEERKIKMMTQEDFEALPAEFYGNEDDSDNLTASYIEEVISNIIDCNADNDHDIIATIRACSPIKVTAYRRWSCESIGTYVYTADEVESMMRISNPEWFEPV